jgi:DNA-binding IclR family transcriptional regulator
MSPGHSRDTSKPARAAAGSPSRTLEKGLLVLNLFDVEHPDWTLKEIREQASLPKATGFRLVKTLANLKYLSYDPKKGTYHLGSSMLRAAYLTLSHSELVRIAKPYVQSLAATTTETVNLTVWTDQGAMIIDSEYTSRPFKPYNPPGVFMNGLANVHFRIFVAFGPESAWAAAIARSQEPRTVYTVTNPDRLLNELIRTRREGVAFGLQEYRLGMCAVGTPVFGSGGEVRACMAVVAPSERFGPGEMMDYAKAVKTAGSELSREFGYRGE